MMGHDLFEMLRMKRIEVKHQVRVMKIKVETGVKYHPGFFVISKM